MHQRFRNQFIFAIFTDYHSGPITISSKPAGSVHQRFRNQFIFAIFTYYYSGPITISSKPAWQRAPEAQEPDYAVPDEEESDAEVGCAIMGLHYTYQPAPSRASSARRTPAFLQHNDSIVRYDISVKLPNYRRALSCLAFVLQMVQCVSHAWFQGNIHTH